MAITDKLAAIADAIRVQSGKTDKLTLAQMPDEIINLQSLAFEIVGNPQPSNPKENTIWVDTDTKITGWTFSASEPDMVEGSLWINVGVTSTVPFNALKKNGIIVYPQFVKQATGGAWLDKKAPIYQGGAWKEWALFLLPSELEYVKFDWTNSDVTVSGDVVNFNVSKSSESNWSFAFSNPVDVTSKKYLRATINLTNDARDKSGIAICSARPTTYNISNVIAEHRATALGVTELEIPLDGVTGNVYIVANGIYASGSITNFRLV